MTFNLDKENSIRKWMSIVEAHVGSNEFLNKYFCYYFEWYLFKHSSDAAQLGKEVFRLAAEAKKMKRYKVVATHYNPYTSKVEYELDDGRIVEPGDDLLTIEDIKNLFGLEFIKDIDLSEYRDMQINDLNKKSDN